MAKSPRRASMPLNLPSSPRRRSSVSGGLATPSARRASLSTSGSLARRSSTFPLYNSETSTGNDLTTCEGIVAHLAHKVDNRRVIFSKTRHILHEEEEEPVEKLVGIQRFRRVALACLRAVKAVAAEKRAAENRPDQIEDEVHEEIQKRMSAEDSLLAEFERLASSLESCQSRESAETVAEVMRNVKNCVTQLVGLCESSKQNLRTVEGIGDVVDKQLQDCERMMENFSAGILRVLQQVIGPEPDSPGAFRRRSWQPVVEHSLNSLGLLQETLNTLSTKSGQEEDTLSFWAKIMGSRQSLGQQLRAEVATFDEQRTERRFIPKFDPSSPSSLSSSESEDEDFLEKMLKTKECEAREKMMRSKKSARKMTLKKTPNAWEKKDVDPEQGSHPDASTQVLPKTGKDRPEVRKPTINLTQLKSNGLAHLVNAESSGGCDIVDQRSLGRADPGLIIEGQADVSQKRFGNLEAVDVSQKRFGNLEALLKHTGQDVSCGLPQSLQANIRSNYFGSEGQAPARNASVLATNAPTAVGLAEQALLSPGMCPQATDFRSSSVHTDANDMMSSPESRGFLPPSACSDGTTLESRSFLPFGAHNEGNAMPFPGQNSVPDSENLFWPSMADHRNAILPGGDGLSPFEGSLADSNGFGQTSESTRGDCGNMERAPFASENCVEVCFGDTPKVFLPPGATPARRRMGETDQLSISSSLSLPYARRNWHGTLGHCASDGITTPNKSQDSMYGLNESERMLLKRVLAEKNDYQEQRPVTAPTPSAHRQSTHRKASQYSFFLPYAVGDDSGDDAMNSRSPRNKPDGFQLRSLPDNAPRAQRKLASLPTTASIDSSSSPLASTTMLGGSSPRTGSTGMPFVVEDVPCHVASKVPSFSDDLDRKAQAALSTDRSPRHVRSVSHRVAALPSGMGSMTGEVARPMTSGCELGASRILAEPISPKLSMAPIHIMGRGVDDNAPTSPKDLPSLVGRRRRRQKYESHRGTGSQSHPRNVDLSWIIS